MKRPSPHLHIVRLVNDTTLIGPETMEGQDQFLERHSVYSLARGDDLILACEIGRQASKNAFTLSRNKPFPIEDPVSEPT